MTAFIEGLFKFLGLLTDGAFWVGIIMIGLFILFCAGCYVGMWWLVTFVL